MDAKDGDWYHSRHELATQTSTALEYKHTQIDTILHEDCLLYTTLTIYAHSDWLVDGQI